MRTSHSCGLLHQVDKCVSDCAYPCAPIWVNEEFAYDSADITACETNCTACAVDVYCPLVKVINTVAPSAAVTAAMYSFALIFAIAAAMI